MDEFQKRQLLLQLLHDRLEESDGPILIETAELHTIASRHGLVGRQLIRTFEHLVSNGDLVTIRRLGNSGGSAVYAVEALTDHGLTALGELPAPRQEEQRPSDDFASLEPEQRDLLIQLVEAARSVPRDQRRAFQAETWIGGEGLRHPGLPEGEMHVYLGDVQALTSVGLLTITNYVTPGEWYFDVSPQGYVQYELLKQLTGQPAERVEADVRRYLDGSTLQQRHPRAYAKWSQAEALLWGSDSQHQLTAVGHLCREAVQEFGTELIERYRPPGAPANPANTVARIRAVLNQRSGQVGDTERAFLAALLAYWGTLIDLIQRQEHGGQREGTPLVWEDSRRVVFQTAVLMFELDHSLARQI